MTERVRPPRDLESLLDGLKDQGVFETKQKGMMFAAALGAWLTERGEEIPELDRRGEGIRLEYFRTVNDDGFIDAIAVTHENALGVLAPSRILHRIDLFERLAFLGLRHLEKALDGGLRPTLDVILELVEKAGEDGAPEELPGLEGVEGVIFG